MQTPNNSERPLDAQKDDGSGPDVASTKRTCKAQVYNVTGHTITDIQLTHKSGSNTDRIIVPKMVKGDVSYEQVINYETGGASPYYDYWYASFKVGNDTYETPYNDRCNVSESDANDMINCQLQRRVNEYELYVNLPSGGGCTFVIKKKKSSEAAETPATANPSPKPTDYDGTVA